MFNRFIKVLISLIFLLFEKVTNIILFCFNRKHSGKFIALTYHSVKPWQLEKFAHQMERIKKIGKPIFAYRGKNCDRESYNIAVTFDDGFNNFIQNAYPILIEKRIPVTLFITTGYLGKSPGWIKDPSHENAQELLMTEDQLRAFPVDEIMIGSHCITHPRLTSLKKEKIIEELSGSKRHLEEIINREVIILSFPYDDYNDEVIKLAKIAGYSNVYKDTPSFPLLKTDNFLLGRISVSLEEWDIEFWLKLKDAYRWLPLAVRIKRFFKKELGKFK